MAVLTKDTNIHFTDERDKQRILSILKNTEKPSQDVLNRLSKAVNRGVKENLFTHGRWFSTDRLPFVDWWY